MLRHAHRLLPAPTFLMDPPRFDLHLHTCFTDGRCSVREMLQSAEQQGLEGVAFTEHVRRKITWWDAFREEVVAERVFFPNLEVLIGIEAKALNFEGGLDADEELIQSVDLVLGAVHGFPREGGGFWAPEELSMEEAARIEREAAMALLEHAPIDVLAHPGALTKRYFGSFPQEDLRALIRKAVEMDKAIEINAEYNRPVDIAWLLQACVEAKARISPGSNAHQSGEVGKIQSCIEEAGYEA